MLFRLIAALTLAAALAAPASAQPKSCADTVTVEGASVCVNFTVLPGTANSHAVVVTTTYSSGNKVVQKTVDFDIVPGSSQSRTIDDVDIAPIAPGKTLHNTLRYTVATGVVSLERSLLLPGAIPLK